MDPTERIRGVMAMPYTALTSDFRLDEDAIRREIDWVLAHGATGIWPGGFAGHWAELNEADRRAHLRICIEHAPSSVLRVAGCHATNTIETIRLANFAERLGYDVIWISPTLPRKATERELLRHHRMVLEHTSAPIAIYDANPITHYLPPRLIGEIAALSERFVAMKSIVGDSGHIAALHDGKIDRQMRILGVESTMLAHLELGSPGALAGSDWVPMAVAIFEAFHAGRLDRARRLQRAVLEQVPFTLPRVASLAMGAPLAHSGIGFVKARFTAVSGIDIGPPMPPYEPADSAEWERAAREAAVMRALLAE